MPAQKRKRNGNGNGTYTPSFKRPRTKKPRLFRPGYDRTSGNFGRFGKSGEEKFFDSSYTSTVVASSGQIAQDSLNEIAQGTQESQRIGRKVTIKKILINGSFYLPSTATVADCNDRARFILYVDRQANGAAAGISGTGGLLELAAVDSFNNLSASQRFYILHNKWYDVNSTGGAGNGTADTYTGSRRSFKIKKNVSIPIEFNSTTGAITEIRSNNLGVLLISNSGKVQCGFRCRLRYKDNGM